MKILVVTDDLIGPVMAGSALRAWELSRVLFAAGHDVVLTAAENSGHPEGHGPPVTTRARWRWPDAVVAPPWSLPPRAFLGNHHLVIDGATPLLAELTAAPSSPAARRRRRTAACRLPLVAARSDAVLAAGEAQIEWWSERLGRRPDTPVLDVPFGIPNDDPSDTVEEIEGVPSDWAVVLWWGGVWPWLDLETLLAARSQLGTAKISVVVPTANRPGADTPHFSTRDLMAAAKRHGLEAPAVVPLEHWVPYAERDRVLNRASLLAVLHRSGDEADLSFRTRALDGVWAGVPLLLSEGGAVASKARAQGWGGVVPPGDVDLTASAMRLLLGRREQDRCRLAIAQSRRDWRWSNIAQPLVDLLPGLPQTARSSLFVAAAGAAASLLGFSTEVGRQ